MLGMSLEECQRKISHREFLSWCLWLRDDRKQPDRKEWYLIQLTMEVRLLRYAMAKINKRVSAKELIIPFDSKPKVESVEQTKTRWFGMVGKK